MALPGPAWDRMTPGRYAPRPRSRDPSHVQFPLFLAFPPLDLPSFPSPRLPSPFQTAKRHSMCPDQLPPAHVPICTPCDSQCEHRLSVRLFPSLLAPTQTMPFALLLALPSPHLSTPLSWHPETAPLSRLSQGMLSVREDSPSPIPSRLGPLAPPGQIRSTHLSPLPLSQRDHQVAASIRPSVHPSIRPSNHPPMLSALASLTLQLSPTHSLAAAPRPSFTSRCSPSPHSRLASPLAGLSHSLIGSVLRATRK
jgi:hypothetical protein